MFPRQPCRCYARCTGSVCLSVVVRLPVSIGANPIAVPYLCLCESQLGGQLSAFRQGEVLRPLKDLVELLQLEGGVDGARLPHLLALATHSDRTLIVRFFWKERRQREFGRQVKNGRREVTVFDFPTPQKTCLLFIFYRTA